MKIKDLVEKIQKIDFTVTGSKSGKNGFIRDKSYSFDLIYAFIRSFYSYGRYDSVNKCITIRKDDLSFENLKMYVYDLFCLPKKKESVGGNDNYISETIALLKSFNIINEKNKGEYCVKDMDLFFYILYRPENAFILIYLAAYTILKENIMLQDLKEYISCKDDAASIKEKFESFRDKYKKIFDINNNYADIITKHILNIFSSVNNGPYVSRSGNEQSDREYRLYISVNQKGKGADKENNQYLQTFDMEYVRRNIKDYLLEGNYDKN